MNLNSTTFYEFAQIAAKEAGIQLEGKHERMLTNRMAARVRELELPNYEEYLQRIQSLPVEMHAFIDSVTTNFTSFFRDPGQFQHLQRTLEAMLRSEPNRVRIWCAACSTGEEPYSLALTAKQVTQRLGLPSSPVRVLATDINQSVLKGASNGVYTTDQLAMVPESLRGYFVRDSTESSDSFRVCREIRESVLFRRLNLCHAEWDIPGDMDVIFLRNVLIYFDQETQRQVLARCLEKLKPGGLLYVGACESVRKMLSGAESIEPSIFRKRS
ncbi:MAG: protein-glutamate O-methyltransferase CheR [Planctomycetota bacterium]